jgi:hypothetical protein
LAVSVFGVFFSPNDMVFIEWYRRAASKYADDEAFSVEQQNNRISRLIPDRKVVDIRSSVADTSSAASTTRRKKVSGVSLGRIFNDVKICSFAILLLPRIQRFSKASFKIFQSDLVSNGRDFSHSNG